MTNDVVLAWVLDDDVLEGAEWHNTEIGGFIAAPKVADAGYSWQVMFTTEFISGPYPGTPDWTETIIGEGDEPTLAAAKWAAWRAFDRAMVAEATENWLMDEAMSGDPENGDPDWWMDPRDKGRHPDNPRIRAGEEV